MKCKLYIIIPQDILASDYDEYIKKVMLPYDDKLSVPLWKDFHTKEQTTFFLKRNGISLEEYLQENIDASFENDCIYFWSDYNKNAMWDWFIIEEYAKLEDINGPPASIILLDGSWIDINDFGYNMNLNDYPNEVIHPQNQKALACFKKEFLKIKQKQSENIVANLLIHY